MTFFHDLNKRLAALASKQDAQQIAESKKVEAVAKSPLTQALTESEKWIQKAVNPKNKGNLHKALHVAQDKKIPKAKIEKATHSKNPKLRHMAQFAKNVANEEMADEGNAFTGALAKTPKGGKFKVGNKEFTDTSSIEEGTCPGCNCAPCQCNEGNAFTGALAKTPKGGKFKVGNKEFTDTSDLEEGFKEMDAWLAQREKEKGTGKFDKKERTLPGGMKATTYTRKHEDDAEDDEVKSDEPKRRGRPKGKDKGPERVTKGAWKHKGKRKEKTDEDLDTDGVMMTRPTNCSSESIEHDERAEYDDEAGMAKDSLHTIVRHAKELERALRDNENMPEWVQEKIGQIKGMMSSVTDYIISTHERDVEQATGREGITIEPVAEKAVSQAQQKFMGMAHAMQKGEKIKGASKELKKVAKSMKPSDTHDFAATKHKGLPKHVEEESTAEKDDKAERAAKKVAKDIEYDEGHKGKDDNKAERAGKKVKKDIEYDDKKDKEEKVDETTVAGSVAPVQNAAPKGKGGMQFGKGVYESLNNSVEKMITESISVQSKMEECGDGNMAPQITITADGEEAAKLMMLLKLAGLESQIPATCPTCGATPCACDEIVDENSPDWPTNTEKLDAEPNLRTYSGGLNGPKSTGQTTVPVVASQLRRQKSMEESVELERTLFKTWKNYKG
jgi:hypothetical protein